MYEFELEKLDIIKHLVGKKITSIDLSTMEDEIVITLEDGTDVLISCGFSDLDIGIKKEMEEN